MKGWLLILSLIAGIFSHAQPYIDLGSLRYLGSPVLSGKGAATRLGYFVAGALLPIQFRNSKDAILFSPAVEEWSVTQESVLRVRGLVLPLSYLKTEKSGKWSVLTTVITRWNYPVPGNMANALQIGGAVIDSVKRSEVLIYKFGLYYNREFFGNFFMPLAGIDWRIDAANRLFGVFPGNFTYEHKWSRVLYWGAVFRAITNSYRLASPDSVINGYKARPYLRIDDNQLGLFPGTNSMQGSRLPSG